MSTVFTQNRIWRTLVCEMFIHTDIANMIRPRERRTREARDVLAADRERTSSRRCGQQCQDSQVSVVIGESASEDLLPPCAHCTMVHCNRDECSVPAHGDQEEGGIDNRGVDSDGSSDLSDVDDCSDVTTDGNALALTAGVQTNDRANFGNIAVKNSTDIHFGNKTFYQGPVTIKQFVYSSGPDGDLGDAAKEFKEDNSEGIDNQLKILSSEASAKDRIVQIPNGFGKSDASPEKPRVPVRVVAVSATLVLSVVVTVVTVAVVLVLTSRDNMAAGGGGGGGGGGGTPSWDGIENLPPNTNYPFNLSGKLRILARKQWLAQPPAVPLEPLRLPVPYVIISHTASDNCSSQSECTFLVRTTQSFHVDSWGWNDIGYNFLVGGDGYAYEGRGWDSVGAHTYGYNNCSIGISFIGTFVNLHPPERQMLAARQLMELGVKLGKIRSDYFLIGHRQASPTESPGRALFQDIKALPHWTASPVKCADLHNTTVAK